MGYRAPDKKPLPPDQKANLILNEYDFEDGAIDAVMVLVARWENIDAFTFTLGLSSSVPPETMVVMLQEAIDRIREQAEMPDPNVGEN